MRKFILALLVSANAIAQTAPTPPVFPPGATLEQKKEIIRRRMEEAAKQRYLADKKALDDAHKQKDQQEKEAADANEKAKQDALPAIKQWIKVYLDSDNFEVVKIFDPDRHIEGMVGFNVEFQYRGNAWEIREFFIRDGKVVNTMLTSK